MLFHINLLISNNSPKKVMTSQDVSDIINKIYTYVMNDIKGLTDSQLKQ